MMDFIILSFFGVTFAFIIRYLYRQQKLAKESCKGLACFGCAKLLNGCGEPKDIVNELRKELHK